MNILLVRHGETAWNREGRYQGRTDIALSPDGERQVKALGERLKDISIAVALSSPLSRARATAQAIIDANTSRRTPDLAIDGGLVEISHGEWEGQLASEVEISHAEMFGVWKSAPGRDSPAGPGAETLGDVEARAWPVFVRAVEKLRVHETALITAHDAVNRVLLCRIIGLPLERVWAFRQSPAALNVFSGRTFDELQLVRLNDSEHSAPLFKEAQHRAL